MLSEPGVGTATISGGLKQDRSPRHHGSHRHLFKVLQASPDVDALVVPTMHPSERLDTAVSIAAWLRCPLIVLCSGFSSAADSRAVAETAGIELIAIDIDDLPTGLMPRFRSTELLAGTRFEHDADTWLKRNLGLLLARFLDWRRIVFLDDDILIPQPHDLRDAVRLLDFHDSVGLAVGGFVDNSVVCHAYREIGGKQETFVSGGALAVDTETTTSFFPKIYNEDWFFLLNQARLRSTAMIGTAIQKPIDIYKHTNRARDEEFGDCLGEGVFRLIDDGRLIREANFEYWTFFLADRLRLIEEILIQVPRLDKDPKEITKMIASLSTAYAQSELIEPALCVEFLHAWQLDRIKWRDRLVELDIAKESTLDRASEKVLAEFGLAEQGYYLPSRSSENLKT